MTALLRAVGACFSTFDGASKVSGFNMHGEINKSPSLPGFQGAREAAMGDPVARTRQAHARPLYAAVDVGRGRANRNVSGENQAHGDFVRGGRRATCSSPGREEQWLLKMGLERK